MKKLFTLIALSAIVAMPSVASPENVNAKQNGKTEKVRKVYIDKSFSIVTMPSVASPENVNAKQNDKTEKVRKVYIDKSFSGIQKVTATKLFFLDVNLTQSSDEQTRVYAVIEYKGGVEYFEVKYEQKGGELKIFLEDLKKGKNSNVEGGRIDIKLGKGVKEFNAGSLSGDVSIQGAELENAIVETVSGDLEIRASKISKLNGTTVSGDVEAENLTAKNTVFAAVSGDVVTRSGSLGIVSLKTTSGDVYVNNAAFDKLTASAVSGDVWVSVVGSINDYNRNIKKMNKTESFTASNKNKSIDISAMSGDVILK